MDGLTSNPPSHNRGVDSLAKLLPVDDGSSEFIHQLWLVVHHSLYPASNAEAQNAINILDEAVGHQELETKLRKKCLVHLRRICAESGQLPDSYKLPIKLDPSEIPHRKSGPADIYITDCGEKRVAVKVLRGAAHQTNEDRKIKGRFCKELVTLNRLRHPNIMPFLGVAQVQDISFVTFWMKNGNIVDFVRNSPAVNRYKLLADAARGLEFLHSADFVHGKLKGANILIDDDKNARLGDAGFVTAVSEGTTGINATSGTSNGIQFGARVAAPEILCPDEFGLPDDKVTFTKASDIYAMGSVIYEVVTGTIPFPTLGDARIIRMIMRGQRPPKPAAVPDFSDSAWKLAESCWKHQPTERPPVSKVLMVLTKEADIRMPNHGDKVKR